MGTHPKCSTHIRRRCVDLGDGLSSFAGSTLLNVSYDPTREFYQEYNVAFAAHWKSETGARRHLRPVPRRIGQAGAFGHRRSGSRRGDAGPGLRRGRDRRRGPDRPGLAVASAAQQLALHLDHRVPRAQGQSQGILDWEDLARPGTYGDHAESEDLGRGPLELPGGLGLTASSRAGPRPRPANWCAASTATCRSSTPGPAARRSPSWSAASATC